MTDAGMPMPALVFRMPMPTYAAHVYKDDVILNLEVRYLWINLEGGIGTWVDSDRTGRRH
jgi:hypothetical protein